MENDKKLVLSKSVLSLPLLKKLKGFNSAILCLLLFVCAMMSSVTGYSSATRYAVYGLNTPVGPATYCQGGTLTNYTCTDMETNCSASSSNTNTITWQWYVDAGTPVTGGSATGTFTASGGSNTATLLGTDAAAFFNTLAPGTHTLYCSVTPNQSNCYYYAYSAITSPSISINITASTVGPITGPTSICPGSTVNYSDATSGGVWSSDNVPVASIIGTGAATGGSAGTANISYTLGACGAGLAVTVGSLPAITGPTGVCVGSTINLSDGTSGGVWSSSNTAAATISATGVVTGVAGGTANISYTSGACSVTSAITVGTPIPAITGIASVCIGLTTHLSDAAAGGVWSSSNTGIATVSATGVVSGVTSGTVTITYTTICSSTISVTVGGAIAAITGATTACMGLTTHLSDATAGGVWSSSNTAVATISATGIVTGVSGGTTNISYTVGSCGVGIVVTVNSVPAITGNAVTCPAGTTNLSDATPGGVWSSGTMSVATVTAAGVVTGVTVGTAVISYTVSGCSATVSVTVNVLPAITGNTNVCAGSTTILSDALPGGVWSSSSTAVATVSATGVVTGVASGSASIVYTVGTCSVNILVNVGVSLAAIAGTTKVCVGSSTHLSDATPGGAWSSTNTSIATISNTAIVSAIGVGVTIISYTFGACTVTTTVTVDAPNAGTITGKDSVCIGAAHAITLSDNVSGGVWSSSSTTHATVTPVTGIVTGVFTGVDTIKYTITNSCGTFTAKFVIHIRTVTQCNLGINQGTEGQLTELKIFPNPNGGTFTMNLVSDIAEEVHVVVTNIVGEKVREFITTTNNEAEIKLNPAAGIYLLSASTVHGKYVTKVEVNK